jgi:hypothetical protein
MSHEDAAIVEEARSFLAELIGEGVPIQNLLNTGEFPAGWAERYLAFVERVSTHYGDSMQLPREVFAVIYAASVYCTKRYLEWQRLEGGVVNTTEAVVDEVRWAGDRLVLRWS